MAKRPPFIDTQRPMSSWEYGHHLRDLGLDHAEASELLGFHPFTSRRYAAGTLTVPPILARYLRLIAAKRLRPAKVRSLLAPWSF